MLRLLFARDVHCGIYNNSLYRNHKKRRLNMTPLTPEI